MSKQRNILSILVIGLALLLAACGTGGPDLSEQEDLPELASNLHRAMITLPFQEEPQEVTYEVRNGLAFFEDDIILGEVDENGKLIQEGLNTQGFAVGGNQNSVWAGGVIPYEIRTTSWGSDSAEMVKRVNEAIAHWHEKTHIRLVPRNGQKSYVVFKEGDGCSSQLGREGVGDIFESTFGKKRRQAVYSPGFRLSCRFNHS